MIFQEVSSGNEERLRPDDDCDLADFIRRDSVRRQVDGNVSADVCIIGAGIAGMITAYLLTRAKASMSPCRMMDQSAEV